MDTPDTNRQQPVFLTAWWRNLVMLNYEVDPDIVAPLVPRGIELDEWQGSTLVSIVAFEFADVRILNMPVPFHRHFEEINLRFYVRRRTAGGSRRGVVFIRELVRLPIVSFLARRFYGEPYRTVPMARHFRRHTVTPAPPGGTPPARATTVRYSWRQDGRRHHVEATADTVRDPRQPEPGSEEEFITDHTYGYGTHRGRTIEYVVEHPRWRYRNPAKADLYCTASTLRSLYGEAFVPFLREPRSALLVEGSPVTVRRPRVIRA